MRSIRQKALGKLFVENGRGVLWKSEDETPIGGVTPTLYYLRYALTVRGPEFLVFPAFVLDDNGTEIRKLRLYDWLRNEGDYFPRADLFGYLQENGKETQHFVRELEIHYKYPVFAYPSLETPLEDGIPLEAIVLASDDAQVTKASKIKRPVGTRAPLRRATIQWWQIPTNTLETFKASDILR